MHACIADSFVSSAINLIEKKNALTNEKCAEMTLERKKKFTMKSSVANVSRLFGLIQILVFVRL